MAPLIGFQETFASFGTESAEPKILHGSCKVLNWTNYPIRGKDSCEDKEVDPAYRALVDHTELVDHVNQMCGQEQKFLQEFNEKICDTDSSQDQHQVFQIPAIRYLGLEEFAVPEENHQPWMDYYNPALSEPCQGSDRGHPGPYETS